jgi:hypothetical protein
MAGVSSALSVIARPQNMAVAISDFTIEIAALGSASLAMTSACYFSLCFFLFYLFIFHTGTLLR